MGRTEPQKDDYCFSPTTKKHYHWYKEVIGPTYITLPFGDDLFLNSKYKTLEHLQGMAQDDDRIKFVAVIGDDGEDYTMAVVFGHYQHKIMLEQLKRDAAKSNADIEKQFKGYRAAGWAKANPTHKLARARAKAWRDFLTFNDCVICLDFAHAMTVHKSQGSTYKTVYVDMNDLYKASNVSMIDYLKLTYVAISRASHKVETT